MKLADTPDLGSGAFGMGVQVPPPAVSTSFSLTILVFILITLGACGCGQPFRSSLNQPILQQAQSLSDAEWILAQNERTSQFLLNKRAEILSFKRSLFKWRELKGDTEVPIPVPSGSVSLLLEKGSLLPKLRAVVTGKEYELSLARLLSPESHVESLRISDSGNKIAVVYSTHGIPFIVVADFNGEIFYRELIEGLFDVQWGNDDSSLYFTVDPQKTPVFLRRISLPAGQVETVHTWPQTGYVFMTRGAQGLLFESPESPKTDSYFTFADSRMHQNAPPVDQRTFTAESGLPDSFNPATYHTRQEGIYILGTDHCSAALYACLKKESGCSPVKLPPEGNTTVIPGSELNSGILVAHSSPTKGDTYYRIAGQEITQSIAPSSTLTAELISLGMEERAVMMNAPDGVNIPGTLVRATTVPVKAVIIEVYGAYGKTIRPKFAVEDIPFYEAGIAKLQVYARGGGECSTQWRDAGRGKFKSQTISDLLTAATYAQRYAAPVFLAARSAGALPAAIALSEHPELFTGAVLEAPFVNLDWWEAQPDAERETSEWGTPGSEAFTTLKGRLGVISTPTFIWLSNADRILPLASIRQWIDSKIKNPLVFISEDGSHSGARTVEEADEIRALQLNFITALLDKAQH